MLKMGGLPAYLRESGYFDAASHEKWLLHTWSLSVEWQFYMVYPLIILIARKLSNFNFTRTLLVVMAAGSFALCLYASTRSPNAAFYMLPTRAWEMLAGGLIYLFPIQMKQEYKKSVSLIGLTMIAASTFFLTAADVWPGWLALIPVLGTALVICAADQSSVLTNNKISEWIGEASYSIYLWHWPIVVLINYYGFSGSSSAIAAGIAISIALGIVSLHLIEKPSRDLKVQLSQAPHLACYVAITLMIGLPAALVFANHGIESRVSALVAAADRERTNKNPSSKNCFLETGVDSPKCIFGNIEKPVGVIVIGDSHSDATVSAVVDAAGPDRSTLYLGYIGCMTIPEMKLQGQNSGYQCGDFVRKQIDELSTTLPGVPLVVTNRSSLYVLGHNEEKDKTNGPLMYFDKPGILDAAYKEDYRKRFISSMCEFAKNRPVYVTKPIPEMGVNVPTVVARGNIRNIAKNVELPVSEYRERNSFVVSVMHEAAQTCGIHLLDPEPSLCDSTVCFGSDGGRPLYWDDDHLSESGNKKLIPMYKQIWN